MKRILSPLTVALSFVALVLALSVAGPTRTVKAGDINDRCNHCLEKAGQDYEACQAKYGFDNRCDDAFNQDIIHCYRNFCEQ